MYIFLSLSITLGTWYPYWIKLYWWFFLPTAEQQIDTSENQLIVLVIVEYSGFKCSLMILKRW